MYKLSLFLLLLFQVGCKNDIVQSDNSTQMLNVLLNYETPLVKTCEYDYDEAYSTQDVPDGVYLKSFPPFDSLSCISTINTNNLVLNEYLSKKCLTLKIDKNLTKLSQDINPITYERVSIYLDTFIRINDDPNIKNFDIYKAGVNLTLNEVECKNQFSSIYNFSHILLNKNKTKGVVILHLQGHQEENAAYFFIKNGDIWFLEAKEIM